MNFTSSTFLLPSSPDDRNIQVSNTLGVIVYTIDPCSIRRLYTSNTFNQYTGNFSISCLIILKS